MSTNNFKFENILIAIPDFNIVTEDEEYIGYNESAHHDYITDVQSQLEKIGFESCDKWDNDRSYNGNIIASWGLQDNKDLMIKYLEVVVRGGYYGGANIDYIIDGDFGVENEQNKKQIAHYEALNRKFDRMVEKTEKILRKNGTELLKVAQFSNGEAAYEVKKQHGKR